MNIKKINEALNGIKQSLRENEVFSQRVMSKLPKLAKIIQKTDPNVFDEMDAIEQILFPNGESIYRVFTPGHSFFYSEMEWLGEEDGGLDLDVKSNIKRIQSLANYSMSGKACKTKKVL